MDLKVGTKHWLRFEHGGKAGFGTLDGDVVTRYEGEMLGASSPTAQTFRLADVRLLAPTEPTKLIGLWNNFAALGEKLSLAVPPEPLYFLKGANSFITGGETIRKPPFYDGRVIFEAELGIVIGKRCSGVDEAQANDFIFGYTCINDVTAFDVLNADASFAQWTRAKSFDTFGVFGPVVATGLDPDTLVIRAILDGEERQNYPASDMLMKPARLVSAISRDMTLMPGDVIACGTSIGAGKMKPGSTIEVTIDGIGTLSNRFES
jgi:2-keto-4-pentenoate hydratase/2-oxohepta-3-ene-1,7-dioic acid hydratase in catechol pathway